MDTTELNEILNQLFVRNTHIHFKVGSDGGEMWIQVCDDWIGDEANGRKWRISKHSTKSEVVQTAFKACLTWMEHELRENFTYRAVSVFSPHYDVDALVELHQEKRFDVRSKT